MHGAIAEAGIQPISVMQFLDSKCRIFLVLMIEWLMRKFHQTKCANKQ